MPRVYDVVDIPYNVSVGIVSCPEKRPQCSSIALTSVYPCLTNLSIILNSPAAHIHALTQFSDCRTTISIYGSINKSDVIV